MSYAAFFVLAIPLVLSALGVVLSRHPVRSALSLVMTLFLLAVVFVLLDAHLVAALQIVVYAGAIMVLFLFVIMLLNLREESSPLRWRARQVTAVVASSLLALFIIRFLSGVASPPGAGMQATPPESFGTTAALSERLFTHWVLPFEITSILLLVAVVGAVVLAKKKLN